MGISSRKQIRKLLGRYQAHPLHDLIKLGVIFGLALYTAYIPTYEGLELPGRRALFILLFAAGLWMTEALAAFAVAFLVIGLCIFLLSGPEGGNVPWDNFTDPWASPVIWLFMGGLILARAAEKTGVNKTVSAIILSRFGKSQGLLLFGIMFITFIFSNFMSNTATAAMMLGLMGPLLTVFADDLGRKKAFLLSVPLGANIGGMGSLIGTPPNAIAAAMLEKDGSSVSFVEWMYWGMPPALICLVVLWYYLKRTYRCRGELPCKIEFETSKMDGDSKYVMGVFVLTVSLWCSSSLHGLPSAVVAFVPIVLLPLKGIIEAEDMRKLPWEVLVLLSGGLTLGVAVDKSGLATWLVGQLPSAQGHTFLLVAMMATLACVLSNFMSNTAAANIIMPVAIVMVPGQEKMMLVAIALASSSAMCMPISTPPNALASASGQLQAKDFLVSGMIAGAVGVVSSLLWVKYILG
jgi:solute carrier family 13 (sodium-dependent dicarboxylate transporter), member 2/3/5